jgi:hypothetical protein
MKIFSSVSAILLSEVTIASPPRAHRGSQPPGASIILHVANRLKPVNGLWGIASPVVDTGPTGVALASVESRNECVVPRQFFADFTPALALLQHLRGDRR